MIYEITILELVIFGLAWTTIGIVIGAGLMMKSKKKRSQ